MAKLLNSLIFILFIYGIANSTPFEDDIDWLVIDDLSANSIDGDDGTIDLSYLGPEAYGQPTKQSGDAVAQWSESSLMNPEEMGDFAEGDILMPKPVFRSGVTLKSSLWPNGIIPYAIEGSFSQQQRNTIMKAIADFHYFTCLRFVPYNGERDYVTIQSSNIDCYSSIGRTGGRQELNLQPPGCTMYGTVLHELMHVVGVFHEHSRPERDHFVNIHFNNIEPDKEHNFLKADPRYTHSYGVPYDYYSIMHYTEYAFSKNSQKTVEPKYGRVKLGQRNGFSQGDIMKVNNMYNCKNYHRFLGARAQTV